LTEFLSQIDFQDIHKKLLGRPLPEWLCHIKRSRLGVIENISEILSIFKIQAACNMNQSEML